VLTLFIFGIALGILGAAIVLRFGPASEWLIWPIPSLLSPFACVFYPLATLPPWMQWMSYALAPSYVFEGMRAIIAGEGVSPPLLAAAVALALTYLVLACVVFTRVYRFTLRTGLIARYSAESAA
jgi:ABC-2 type transport system permease protein